MWYGWKAPYIGHSWLQGEISTEELHEFLTDPEVRRHREEDRHLELADRYAHLWNQEAA